MARERGREIIQEREDGAVVRVSERECSCERERERRVVRDIEGGNITYF
jgi:hypothetical protein